MRLLNESLNALLGMLDALKLLTGSLVGSVGLLFASGMRLA
jgi:hypothetical protein